MTPTDVATRVFSIVWASDQPVTSATVRVYADANGVTELTGGLVVTLASLASPPALARGIVKVDVAGLAPDTCYYVQTSTIGTSTVTWPAAPPFTEVCTAIATNAVNASEKPAANDLIALNLFAPDGVTAGTGTLLVVSLPGVASYPVTSFAGQGVEAPATLIDLSRFFEITTRTSLEPAPGTRMVMTQFRGQLCPGLMDHKLTRYRRVPAHLEADILGTPISEVEAGDACFFADTLCDGVIDGLDAQRVLAAFGGVPGACTFNPDLDIVADAVIDVLDLQSVLNRFGQSAP